jgi:AhpD family alkylhydroperoxidase
VPHIPLPDEPPGIAALLAYKPATGTRLAELMHELLRGSSPLTPAERETIGAYVSRLNQCEFCARSHGAALRHLDGGPDLHRHVLTRADLSGVDSAGVDSAGADGAGADGAGADGAGADGAGADGAGADAGKVDGRLGALLRLAGAVAGAGRCRTDEEVAAARAAGAADEEIHDTVLIAASFCLVNRYVDGLAANTPQDEAVYDQMGKRLAEDGYRR